MLGRWPYNNGDPEYLSEAHELNSRDLFWANEPKVGLGSGAIPKSFEAHCPQPSRRGLYPRSWCPGLSVQICTTGKNDRDMNCVIGLRSCLRWMRLLEVLLNTVILKVLLSGFHGLVFVG